MGANLNSSIVRNFLLQRLHFLNSKIWLRLDKSTLFEHSRGIMLLTLLLDRFLLLLLLLLHLLLLLLNWLSLS